MSYQKSPYKEIKIDARDVLGTRLKKGSKKNPYPEPGRKKHLTSR